MKFRIQKYDPDKDAKPYFQDYDLEMGPADRMLLDAWCASRRSTTPWRCGARAARGCAARTR
jgi:succinate dehydrogenase/fumarate reductase-like Fe-S protein